MYHIVVMHSQCTLACPTLSVCSCIQVPGLRLRTQTRGFKEQARDQKNKIRRVFGVFGFTPFFLVFGSKNQKNTCVFLVFALSRSLNRAKTPAIFWFFTQKPKTHMFSLVMARSRSLHHAKTLVLFGFHSKTPKKHMCFFCFSARRHHENQKNTCAFWIFAPKTKKKTVQNQKIQKSSRNQKMLSQLLFFWFFGLGWFC